MSLPAPNESSSKAQRSSAENRRTVIFIVTICCICGVILAILAHLLKTPQEEAKELDRNKQMLIAAQIYNPLGYFQVHIDNHYLPATYDNTQGILVSDPLAPKAESKDILKEYAARIHPFVVNDKGELKSFKEVGLDEDSYIAANKKTGYFSLPWKLLYAIFPNQPLDPRADLSKIEPEGYIIPIAGFGLWDAIYGYIAVAKDGDTVIGITWYQHAETPGLGAVIAEPEWQAQFPGKLIFQEDASGKTNFKTAPMGITVVRGKAKELFGDSPKFKSAVDGIAGATITGNGVTRAYKDSLTPYRSFFLKLREQEKLSP